MFNTFGDKNRTFVKYPRCDIKAKFKRYNKFNWFLVTYKYGTLTQSVANDSVTKVILSGVTNVQYRKNILFFTWFTFVNSHIFLFCFTLIYICNNEGFCVWWRIWTSSWFTPLQQNGWFGTENRKSTIISYHTKCAATAQKEIVYYVK